MNNPNGVAGYGNQFQDPTPRLAGCAPGCPQPAGGDHTPECAVRLGHCTPVWGGHSPACLRDGTYCQLISSHDGTCKPHGEPLTSGELTEMWGK